MASLVPRTPSQHTSSTAETAASRAKAHGRAGTHSQRQPASPPPATVARSLTRPSAYPESPYGTPELRQHTQRDYRDDMQVQ